MNNNDILRRIRYALDLHEKSILEACRLGGHDLKNSALPPHPSREQITEVEHDKTAQKLPPWMVVAGLLKKEEEEGFVACSDQVLQSFLDGLIIQRRGLKEDTNGQEKTEPPLTNNLILKKLRIALELQEDTILEILSLAHAGITRASLNALFRKEGHKNYKECGNQFLRSFLKGLAIYLRNRQVAGGQARPVEQELR